MVRKDDHGKGAGGGVSPVHIARGLTAPRDFEQARGLTYDTTLHVWVYVASYEEPRLARRRANGLANGLNLPFRIIQIGDMRPHGPLHPGAGGRREQLPPRYIPGWYAATYADPRQSP